MLGVAEQQKTLGYIPAVAASNTYVRISLRISTKDITAVLSECQPDVTHVH